MPFKLVTFFL